MKRIEGKIIVTFVGDPTPQEVLRLEQYLNGTVSTMVYANANAALRVHLTDDKPPRMTMADTERKAMEQDNEPS